MQGGSEPEDVVFRRVSILSGPCIEDKLWSYWLTELSHFDFLAMSNKGIGFRSSRTVAVELGKSGR